jgi:hypothetical protein
MDKFEYKLLDISIVMDDSQFYIDSTTLLRLLNDHGDAGWEACGKFTDTLLIMKRKL